MTSLADGDEPRAVTEAELLEQFMDACRTVADHWAGEMIQEGTSVHERISGALHSWLCLIDGVSSAFPCSLDSAAAPHPDDKAYHQGEGENWVEPGTVVNGSDLLHEILFGRGSWTTRKPGYGGTGGEGGAGA